MKKLKLFLATVLVAVAALALTGCGTTPATPTTVTLQPVTPSTQQIVTQACVLLPGILDILAVQDPAFPASVQNGISNAQKLVSGTALNGVAVPGICTAGAAIDGTSLLTLTNTVMPIVVNAIELSPTVTPQVKAEVTAVQGIFLLVQAAQAGSSAANPPAVKTVNLVPNPPAISVPATTSAQ